MDAYQPDHYRVLGVAPQADAQAIKVSYRKLSRVYHPDRQGGSAAATTRFQLISAAYATLSDQALRERYDRLLLLTDPLRFVQDPRADKALQVLDGVVGRLRRRNKQLPRSERGANVRVTTDLPFRLAALGGQTTVDVHVASLCNDCGGEGTQHPERNPACHVCAGDGRVKVGVRRAARSCGFCTGKGVVLLAPCEICDGKGEVIRTRKERVVIPARCRSGALIRVRGGGEANAAGRDHGDLLIQTNVLPDPLFQVEGDDLVVTLPVRWSQLLSGVVMDVPTLHGTRRLRIPEGAANGREIRVRGAGLQRRQGGHGDLRYVVAVDIPTELSAEQAQAVALLEDRLGAADFKACVTFERRVRALAEETGHVPDTWDARDANS